MITFTPLTGGAATTRTIPLCYILQIDDVRILLDCGAPDWHPEPSTEANGTTGENQQGEPHWVQYCEQLAVQAPTVDLVLLSHADIAHVGLFPYAHAKYGLRAPAYASLPVQAMGRMAVLDNIESIRAEEPVDDPATSDPAFAGLDVVLPTFGVTPDPSKQRKVASVKETNDAFDSLHVLRYSQPAHLQGKCQGITITPFSAGHTIGGTIWKIRSPSAGTVVYAVNLNHTKERHLDGTVLLKGGAGGGVLESLSRPDLLITDAERTLVVSARRKDRDATLLDAVTNVLQSGHSVLMPCDASTRVLELLVLFDQHWSFSKLRTPLCLVGRTAHDMLTLVRSMMEWFGGTVTKEEAFDTGNNKKRKRNQEGEDDALGTLALRFKHLEIFPSPDALVSRYPSSMPKLLLVVPATLSHGNSRRIFTEFASVPGNVAILSTPSEPGTLANILFNEWNSGQSDNEKFGHGSVGQPIQLNSTMTLTMNSKIPLMGTELEQYLEKERIAKERQATQRAALARSQRLLEADEADSDSSNSEADEEEVEDALGDDMDTGGPEGDESAKQLSFDIFLKGNVSRAASFFKTAGQASRFRMFPHIERKRRVDEYGETVDVAAWLRKDRAFAVAVEADEAREAQQKKQEEEEKSKIPVEPPSKFIIESVEVELRCKLLFVDMDGLNDGRSVKTIIPQVNPRKMIIVHSHREATDALKESCLSIKAMTRDIHAPDVGESVQIGQQTNVFTVALSDELIASVKMSRFEDNEIGFVHGRVTGNANSTVPVLEPTMPVSSTGDAENVSTPDVRPVLSLPWSTMIGDLRLTALKTRLGVLGIAAEFIGEGVLVCGTRTSGTLDDVVAVRKTARGQVVVEGSISDVYYTVRREVYDLHALVAA
ncbi:cleavage and polyadenylation specificity factor subunit 2 [Rhizoctonia solani 123E]|uniref:Cleavage and polyadenylation specificity factor subunit 2 n=1 Tax=Rhizoctonia solani 123E TaxID=1423351 RepID=A0A074SEV8_9AGAM|nr:cleavage and polyadenylation specificity factor subunit 2 [Rhizoctonia solani 123E]